MNDIRDLVLRHLRWGWGGLLVFLLLGLGLELLHGFKVSAYLAVDNETRRFLWVLAHAHGALLSLINLVFAASVAQLDVAAAQLRWISLGLLSAMVLMPTGFFTGGLVIYQGDPGPGIALALLGAAILIVSVAGLFLRLCRS